MRGGREDGGMYVTDGNLLPASGGVFLYSLTFRRGPGRQMGSRREGKAGVPEQKVLQEQSGPVPERLDLG